MDRPVPWTPRVAPISSKTLPNLLPMVPSALREKKSFSGLDHGLLEAQIELNARALEQIDALKEERNQMAAMQEKLAKEKEMLAVKFNRANEQLQYMVKKMEKRGNASKENIQPNDGDISMQNKQPNDGNQSQNE